ncbi:MAG: hypothetical protein IJY27_04905 [Clostridia bacterium]|nr:hypothetical protein [Clostridia bacterium]
MKNRYLAAIDVGGTKADAVLFRDTGEIVAHVVDPGMTPFDHGAEASANATRKTLEKLFSHADGDIDALYASVATVEYYYDDFIKYFNDKINVKKIRIEGDGCCLISGVLGHNDGACMICGTGSSLYMRKGDSYRHIGGGGHLIDSCGSGYVLGQQALRAVYRACDGAGPQTMLTELVNEQGGCLMRRNIPGVQSGGRAYIASFAKNVFIARNRGDLVARNIFNTCAADMANVIWAAREELGAGFTLVLNGGIFSHYPEYAEAVKALSPADINVILSDVPPLYGCVVEAMYDVGLTCNDAFKARFMADYQK